MTLQRLVFDKRHSLFIKKTRTFNNFTCLVIIKFIAIDGKFRSVIPHFSGEIDEQDAYKTKIEAIVGQTTFRHLLKRVLTTLRRVNMMRSFSMCLKDRSVGEQCII